MKTCNWIAKVCLKQIDTNCKTSLTLAYNDSGINVYLFTVSILDKINRSLIYQGFIQQKLYINKIKYKQWGNNKYKQWWDLYAFFKFRQCCPIAISIPKSVK